MATILGRGWFLICNLLVVFRIGASGPGFSRHLLAQLSNKPNQGGAVWIEESRPHLLRYVFSMPTLFQTKTNFFKDPQLANGLKYYRQAICNQHYEALAVPRSCFQCFSPKKQQVLTYLASYDFIRSMRYNYFEQLNRAYFKGTQEEKRGVDEAVKKFIGAHFHLDTIHQIETHPAYQMLGTEGLFGILEPRKALPADCVKTIVSFLYAPFYADEPVKKLFDQVSQEKRKNTYRVGVSPTHQFVQETDLEAPTRYTPDQVQAIHLIQEQLWQHVAYRSAAYDFFWGATDINGVMIKLPKQLMGLVLAARKYLFDSNEIYGLFIIQGVRLITDLCYYTYVHYKKDGWQQRFDRMVQYVWYIQFMVQFGLSALFLLIYYFFHSRDPYQLFWLNLINGLSTPLFALYEQKIFRYIAPICEANSSKTGVFYLLIGLFYFFIEHLVFGMCAIF